ncbi:MAG: wax ester/triacylglycerol synthase family O-acyltransferase [Thermodesulfobacteriota bacterium]
MGHYDRLSALDASFLDLEDECCHMHVCAVLLLEPGPLRTGEGGVDAARIRSYIESRLHLIPRYRQKLAYTPIERHPVWVDDESFNIFYHIRHTSLPKPGDERQLKRLCGRLFSQKLDHTKPLWELWIVEGLASGHFAVVSKTHHCMVDGISGVDLLSVVLSPSPVPAAEPAPPWKPRPTQSDVQLVAGEAWRRTKISLDIAREAARSLASPISSALAVWDRATGLVETIGGGLTPASETPLNPPRTGPHRRFDWVRFELAEVKAVRAALGGTVNDVVLASATGALHRFLQRHGVPTAGLDFRSLVPVNVRTADQHGGLGNKIAQMIAHLPVDEVDPRARLARVIDTTTKLKSSHQVLASELIEELSDWTATGVLTSLLRLATRQRSYNVIVTNVPGPQIPLFLLGAPLRDIYPMVPLFQGQALGFAIFSYAGGLDWGLVADWDRIPDLHDVVNDLRDSFAELRDVARPAEIRAMAAANAQQR